MDAVEGACSILLILGAITGYSSCLVSCCCCCCFWASFIAFVDLLVADISFQTKQELPTIWVLDFLPLFFLGICKDTSVSELEKAAITPLLIDAVGSCWSEQLGFSDTDSFWDCCWFFTSQTVGVKNVHPPSKEGSLKFGGLPLLRLRTGCPSSFITIWVDGGNGGLWLRWTTTGTGREGWDMIGVCGGDGDSGWNCCCSCFGGDELAAKDAGENDGGRGEKEAADGDNIGETEGDATCHKVGLVLEDEVEKFELVLEIDEIEGCLFNIFGRSSPCNGGKKEDWFTDNKFGEGKEEQFDETEEA